jgi:excisionase family DNA binding protein
VSRVFLDGVTADELIESITDRVIEQLRPLFEAKAGPMLVDRQAMADRLGVSLQTVNRLTASGEIPSVLVGTRRLYVPDRVIEALADQSAVTA